MEKNHLDEEPISERLSCAHHFLASYKNIHLPGKMASLYYVGKLKSNNKQFDACKEGKPFKFRVGQGEVIKAWDIGISGMKVGLLFYRCISVKNGKSLSYPLIKKLD